jgi:hypothetical protein
VKTQDFHLPTALKPTRRSIVVLALLALLLTCAGTGAFLAAPSAEAALTGPSVTVNAGGLVLTMRTARGPYFLRELLPVGLSLTNHSNATVHVPRGSCMYGGALGVTEEGGGAPTFRVPMLGGLFGGGPGIFATDDLVPGQTCATPDVLLPLTASGRITLTAHAALTSITAMVGGGTRITNLDPFTGHAPELALTVAPSAPPDRTLTLWRHTSRVVVLGPPGALLHLDYMYAASSGGCWTGGGWAPLRMPVLDAHPCAGVYGTWSYAIGAPGYAIASDTLSAAQIT